MGCDIHLMIEKKVNGQWEAQEGGYDGRNYNLFAILADVRNGRGFAGIKTGEGFNPIADPRGVPSDASKTYLKDVEYWEGDGHSHSYHTLKQLLDYDWEQATVQYATITEQQFKEYRKTGEQPERWSGAVWGSDCITVDEKTMDFILDGHMKRDEDKKYYIQVKFPIEYKDVSNFYSEDIPKLKEMSEDGIGEDVRIVFFFDN